MKKTIIALLALGGLASAAITDAVQSSVSSGDTTVSLDILAQDWTTGSRLGRPTWVKDDAGDLTLTNSNWSQAYAIHDLSTNVTGVWTLTTSVYRPSNTAGFSITLVGLDKALTIGTQDYGSGTSYYGTTTNVTANGYSFQDALGEISGTKVENSTKGAENVFNNNQTANISASTALDNDNNVLLTLTLDGTADVTPYTTTINMGKGFTLDKIVVWGDGANGTANWKVTDLNLTYSVPEPTTATLSLLALAGLAARRRRK